MLDPITIGLGAGWLFTLGLSGALALHGRWCKRKKQLSDLQGRVANLESALRETRAELVSHRAAIDPAVRRLSSPPPLPPPPARDPHPVPFWARAVTRMAEPSYPWGNYPVQPLTSSRE